ncbi:MAG: hypothetical protein ACREUF_08475 [Solimonas sp.]
MTTDKDDEQESTTTDQAAEAAAFEASFEGSPAEAKAEKPEKTEAPAEPAPADAPKAEVKEAPQDAMPAADQEAAPAAPSPKAEDPELRAEMRKLHGRIGALNDQLQQALKAKETEGKPAVLSTGELKRLKGEYPELAELLEGDLAEVVAGQKAPDPKAIDDLVSQRVAAELDAFRRQAVDDRHETWKTDLWVGQPGETRTAEYAAWLKTMTEDEARAFENSQNPTFVNRKLDQFYDWKNKAAKAETEKQQRLKAALTPQGGARAGQQTMSDEEAERKAFEDAYHS